MSSKDRFGSNAIATMAALARIAQPADGEVWLYGSDFSEPTVIDVDDIADDPQIIATTASTENKMNILFGAGVFPYIDLSGLVGYVFARGQGVLTQFAGVGNYVDEENEINIYANFVPSPIFFAEHLLFCGSAGEVDGDLIGVPMIGNTFFSSCSFQQNGTATGVALGAGPAGTQYDAVIKSSTISADCDFDLNDGSIAALVGCDVYRPITGRDVKVAGSYTTAYANIATECKGTYFSDQKMYFVNGTHRYDCQSVLETGVIVDS